MSNWFSIFKSDGEASATSPTAGLKQDLADLGVAIAGHLRSAAAFLAPPPPSSAGEGFKGGDDVAGVTEEVIEYVDGIVSSKSHCWTDFPLSPYEDFVLSDIQKKHASVVESLVPKLENLKHKMSAYMGEEYFWTIYFALLSPMLNDRDKELLITPQIDKAGAIFLHKLINKKSPPEDLKSSQEAFDMREESLNEVFSDTINVKEGAESSKQKLGNEQPKYLEDVASSDLEDEDNNLSDRFARCKLLEHGRDSSYSDSNEWVRLNEGSKVEGGKLRAVSGLREKDSEGEDSCGWLTIDEVDF